MMRKETWMEILEVGAKLVEENGDKFVVDFRSNPGVSERIVRARFEDEEGSIFNLTLSSELSKSRVTEEIYLHDLNKRPYEEGYAYRLSFTKEDPKQVDKLIQLFNTLPQEERQLGEDFITEHYMEKNGELYFISDNWAETSIDPEIALGLLHQAHNFYNREPSLTVHRSYQQN
jgi:hypothetical protein